MSDVRSESTGGRKSVFNQVCLVLDTSRGDDETVEEFKARVAKAFNEYSEEEFEELPVSIQMWVAETSKIAASNIGKQRPRALPGLPGLDATLQRYDITKPLPKRVPGRTRGKGEDALTRVMHILHDMDDPENAKLDDIRKEVYARHQMNSSDSAINQAAKAYNTAREILGVSNRQRAAAE